MLKSYIMKWERGLMYYFKQIKVDEFDEN